MVLLTSFKIIVFIFRFSSGFFFLKPLDASSLSDKLSKLQLSFG